MIANIPNSRMFAIPGPTGLNIHIEKMTEERLRGGSQWWNQLQVRNGHKQPPEDAAQNRPISVGVQAVSAEMPNWPDIVEEIAALRAVWGDLPVYVAETRGL